MVPPSHPMLRAIVRGLWAVAPGRAAGSRREHVLPSGAMHLVLLLSGRPLRVYAGPADALGTTVGIALVGGARRTHYVKDISAPGGSVGALLRPGAALALFGMPADLLAGTHVPLDALWGRPATEALLDQLATATDDAERLRRLERALLARVGRPPQGAGLSARRHASRYPSLHPAVAATLPAIAGPKPIETIADASGLSHRRFIALFRAGTGLSPQALRGVLRFRRALALLGAEPAMPLAAVAQAAGYADQAHFNRAFREHAGLTPGDWRRAAPQEPSHVPLPAATPVNSIQDAAGRSALS